MTNSIILNRPLKNLKPAKRYSGAVIDIVKEKNLDLDTVFFEIKFASDLICENEELRNFLLNPTVSKKDKDDVLCEIFTGRVSNETVNLLLLLSNQNRLNILGDILSALKDDINEIKNILKTTVISAAELNETQKNLIKTKLQNKFQKEIEADFIKDDSILGGIIIKINDTVIDFSLKRKIENLKK